MELDNVNMYHGYVLGKILSLQWKGFIKINLQADGSVEILIYDTEGNYSKWLVDKLSSPDWKPMAQSLKCEQS